MPLSANELDHLKQGSTNILILNKPSEEDLQAIIAAINPKFPLIMLTITELDIGGVDLLNKLLEKLPNLQELQISQSKIGDKELIKILQVIGRSQLQLLSLVNNSAIKDDSIDPICEFIKDNKLLQLVDLTGTSITSDAQKKINDMVKKNSIDVNDIIILPENDESDAMLNDDKLLITPSLNVEKETKREKTLQKTLTLQPPSAETKIEFNQLFTMKLESVESSFYQNAWGPADESTLKSGATSKTSYRELIDLRPWRWYPQYKRVLEELEENEFDVSINKNLLESIKAKVYKVENLNKKIDVGSLLKNNSKEIDNNEYDNFFQALAKLRDESLALQNKRAQLMGRKIILEREIRSSGYNLILEGEGGKVDESIKRIGFSFHIEAKKSPTGYVPLPIEFDISFNDDIEGNKNWTKFKDELYKHLTTGDKPLLPDGESFKREQYNTNAANLASFDSCPTLQNIIKKTDQSITLQKKQKKALDEKNTQLSKDLTKLKSEIGIQTLDQLKQKLNTANEELSRLLDKDLKPNIIKKGECDRYIDRWKHLKDERDRTPSNTTRAKLDKEIKQLADKIESNSFKNEFELLEKKIKEIESKISSKQKDKQKVEKDIREWERIENTINDYTSQIKKLDNVIKELEGNKQDKSKNGLSEERKNFLRYWNNPPQSNINEIANPIFHPYKDPLTRFWISLEDKKIIKADVSQFNLTPDGFYNQYGQSLQDFLAPPQPYKQNVVVMLPYLMQDGSVSEEVFQVVYGPQLSSKLPSSLPIIKFVETRTIKVSWQQYVLGELKHAVNLAPGEKRKIVIEKQTKLTTTLNSSMRSGEEVKRNATSSFEENLQNEFSTSLNKTDSEEQTRKRDQTRSQAAKSGSDTSAESSKESASTKTKAWHAEAEAEVSVSLSPFSGSGKASGGKSGSSTQENKSASAAKSSTTQSKENALTSSLSEEGQQLSKQSRDIASKNVQNSISKVATETSMNNKVEVTSSSSEQSESSSSNKETMELENQNVGRAVTYNFFQVQNQYETAVHLKDVKIVVNTGQELIDDTGIKDIRVFDISEFNSIFNQTNQSSAGWVVLCALIAVRVLRVYSQLLNVIPENKGAIHINPSYYQSEFKPNEFSKTMAVLDFADDNWADKKEAILQIMVALDALKKIPFVFEEDIKVDKKYFYVNAPAYHMDTQLGLVPATENYLEQRRTLELEKQALENKKQRMEIKKLQAETKYIEGKTKAGVFTEIPPKLPSGFKGGFWSSIPSANDDKNTSPVEKSSVVVNQP